MIYNVVILSLAHVLINFSSVYCNRSLSLSPQVLLFAMSLLSILSREISTLTFCVNGFIVISLLPLILIGQHLFLSASFFLCMVADLLAGRINGTGVAIFRCDGKFQQMIFNLQFFSEKVYSILQQINLVFQTINRSIL